MLLSLNSLTFAVFEKRQRNDEFFFATFVKPRTKDTRTMSSCLLGLLVYHCTRANFAQNLLLINLFMYAIAAVLHNPYILLIAKLSCFSVIYLFKAFDYCNCVSIKYWEYKDPSSTKF